MLSLRLTTLVRSPFSTILILVAPAIVAYILYGLGNLMSDTMASMDETATYVPHNIPRPVTSIPECTGTGCLRLVVSPTDAAADPIWTDVVSTLALDAAEWQTMADAAAVNAYLLAHPDDGTVGIILAGAGTNTPSYTVQYSSAMYECSMDGLVIECPSAQQLVILPAFAAMDTALVRAVTGDATAALTVSSLVPFPHPATRASVMAMYVPMFALLAGCVHAIVLASSLGQEKEHGHRITLVVAGLHPTAYWVSFFISSTLLSLLCAGVFFVSCRFFDIQAFVLNSPAIGILVVASLFMWMAALAALVSRLVPTSSSAAITLFVFTIVVMMLASMVDYAVYIQAVPTVVQYLLTLIQPLAFAHDVIALANAENGYPEITFDNWDSLEYTFGEVSVRLALILSGASVALLWAGTVLTDLAMPSNSGAFLLPRRAYRAKRTRNAQEGAAAAAAATVQFAPEVADATAEAARLAATDAARDPAAEPAVVVSGLSRLFQKKVPIPKSDNLILDFYKGLLAKTEDFWALGGPEDDGMSAVFHRGAITALLGENGCAKSTLISIVIGLLRPTLGTIKVCGLDADTQMQQVRTLLGVCMQHDTVWPHLTCAEHIRMVAQLKASARDAAHPLDVEAEVKARLEDVQLTSKADARVGSLSGGMRRRLSIAMSLVGAPSLLLLDEPTTGLDPVTMRIVWGAIDRFARSTVDGVQRSVLLTTHALEEAEALADTIHIMSAGHLIATGTSLHLKSRYGTGYTISCAIRPATGAAVVAAARERLPMLIPLDVSRLTVTFDLPLEQTDRLADAVAVLEQGQLAAAGVCGFSLTGGTLDSVFIQLAGSYTRGKFGRIIAASVDVEADSAVTPALSEATPGPISVSEIAAGSGVVSP
jgi:ABC-type multidrug transport system ATPase subunit